MKQENVKVGTLVESFSQGFGRITNICNSIIYVKFSYKYIERTYTFADFKDGILKIHED